MPIYLIDKIGGNWDTIYATTPELAIFQFMDDQWAEPIDYSIKTPEEFNEVFRGRFIMREDWLIM